MEQLCESQHCLRERGRGRGRRVYIAEQGLLCMFCRGWAHDNIFELPKLYGELDSSLIRFPFALEERVGGGEVKGLCLNEASVNARFDIMSVLATWSGMVAQERRVTRPADRDVTGLAVFLSRHLDWLLAHHAGACFADELAVTTATARQAGRRDSAPHLSLGCCVEDDCGEALYATGIGADARSSAQVRCEAGHVWQPHEWLVLASLVGGQERRPMRDADARRFGA
jgi:hypothetical protein